MHPAVWPASGLEIRNFSCFLLLGITTAVALAATEMDQMRSGEVEFLRRSFAPANG